MGYTREVHERAWREIDSRRQRAQEEAAARREQIRREIPRIAEIERELAATAASVARTVLTSPPDKAKMLVEELGRRNLALQEQRGSLLAEKGYPADYLEERHTCPRCRDTGYTGVEMCSCLEELLRREAFAQLGQTAPAGESSFAGFRLDLYPDQPVDASGVVPRSRMGEVLEACRQYAESFPPRDGKHSPPTESLLLLGQTGLGKTHLSLAIAQVATQKGYGVVYTPVQRLMDRLEAEKFSRGEHREQYLDSLEYILDCDLLVLDDLGTEFSTSFSTSVLYNIVNSRLSEQRATIISTNLELAAIEERYTQRMVSRLVCGCKVLKFYGKDIRYIKKMQAMQQD